MIQSNEPEIPNIEQMLAGFIQYIEQVIPMSKALRERLEHDLEIVEIPKHGVILKDGQRCDYVSFVLAGLLRAYYVKDEEEICSRFISEKHICFSVISFYTRKPSYEYIEAIEPSLLARIHHDALEKLYNDFPEFNYVTRKWTEHYCSMSEQRLFLLRRQTTEERYQSFLEIYPGLIQRVPLKYIASFLGMNTETVSRIRKRLSRGSV